MSITTDEELLGMQRVSVAVAETLRLMREYTRSGISASDLDYYGGTILKQYGAQSAPKKAYKFPGNTCISVNHEIAHGIPSSSKVLNEGDIINIDVSAELNSFWSDNGCSFIVGEDSRQLSPVVNVSRNILLKALDHISHGVLISDIGYLIETEARMAGFKVIRNLAGHGIGRKLHEYPEYILNFRDTGNKDRFRKNMVVALETFISTRSSYAITQDDGWTLAGNKGGFVAQHEHTIVVTSTSPLILTAQNGI
ncbi:MAG: type I methionyl aminopeptidase [Bacteroidales bacterium]|nr:type I methionyl aminopeptidase [Bacteroidales bacterium]